MTSHREKSSGRDRGVNRLYERSSFDRVIHGLTSPAAYPHQPGSVEVIHTSISVVFLADDLVYKLKKPLKLPFLDYSTLEKRRHFCEVELKLNRRLAPDIYLEVVEIAEDGSDVRIGGQGEAVEYAVEMKRLPADTMMNVLLENERVTGSMVDEIASVLARFHDRARWGPGVSEYGTPANLVRTLNRDMEEVREYVGQTITEEKYHKIRGYLELFPQQNEELLEARVADGRIREGHGDLHSRNICIPGQVYIFDCIEFNPEFRCIDVAKEVAFLAMDLDFYDCHGLSERFVDRYVELSGDHGVRELLDFYKSWLALVRGKVYSIAEQEGDITPAERKHSVYRAKKYFDNARRYAGEAALPRVIMLMGPMGTGKSFLARELDRRLRIHVLDSDVVRKRIAGLDPNRHRYVGFGEDIYSEEMTEKVYGELAERTEKLVKAGYSVLLDASFSRERYRRAILEAAKSNGALALVVYCTAPIEVMRERLIDRPLEGETTSDGRLELLDRQLESFEPPREIDPKLLLELYTDRPVGRLADSVMDRMEELAAG